MMRRVLLTMICLVILLGVVPASLAEESRLDIILDFPDPTITTFPNILREGVSEEHIALYWALGVAKMQREYEWDSKILRDPDLNLSTPQKVLDYLEQRLIENEKTGSQEYVYSYSTVQGTEDISWVTVEFSENIALKFIVSSVEPDYLGQPITAIYLIVQSPYDTVPGLSLRIDNAPLTFCEDLM